MALAAEEAERAHDGLAGELAAAKLALALRLAESNCDPDDPTEAMEERAAVAELEAFLESNDGYVRDEKGKLVRERPDTRRLDGLQQEKDRLAALLKATRNDVTEKRRSLASERDACARDLASAERALLLLGGDVEVAVPPHLAPEPPGSPRLRFGLGTAAARRLPREPGIIRRGRPLGAQESGADAGRYSAARVESNARAAHAWRPAAPRTRRYDCPEERADGRRLGG